LDQLSELKLQVDVSNEKIEQVKADFSQQLETAKDEFRDSVTNSGRFYELKASSLKSEIQQSTSALQAAQEASQQKFRNLAALIKQSEEFLYAHILSAEDKSMQLGQSLNAKHSQDISALDQRIENILSQVSSIEAENMHFRALSDSRINSCEKQFQNNINAAVDTLVKTIESTRQDLCALEAKSSQDSHIAQKRSIAFDSLEGTCAHIAASIASIQGSITGLTESQAALAGQHSSASKHIQEMKLHCQQALTTAKAVEENVIARFQPQFLDITDRIDAIDAQLASLNSGSQHRLEKRFAVIRDEISGHASQSNRVFDRIQLEILEIQDKLSKISVEIVGSAQRADLSHQSLKETLLPSVSSLQASVNSLSFRLNRSLASVQEGMHAVKKDFDSRLVDLACDSAAFSCLEDVISRVENDALSSKLTMLQVQANSTAETALSDVCDKLQKLEVCVQTMDSDQIAAADLFSKRLASVEDSVSATTDHLELVNTQNTLIFTNMKTIEARIASQGKAIGVVEESAARSERVADTIAKEVERLSVASSAAATQIEAQTKAIGVVEESAARSERVADTLAKEVERLSVASSAAATQIEAQTKAIGVVEESAARSERVADTLAKEVERLSVASSAAATRIEAQTKAIGVVEETVGRAELATDALSRSIERQSAESTAMITSACFALREDILQHVDGKVSAVQTDVQVQAEAIQELLETVSKQQAITNDFITEVRSTK
jgi:chromosome segregation ATPase